MADCDVCIICNKVCSNNCYAVNCVLCGKWYHKKCLGMTTEKFNYYEAQQKLAKGDKYKCTACDKSEVNSSTKNKRKKLDEDENSTETWTMDDVMSKLQELQKIDEIMKKLVDMDNRYTSLLEKYEAQIKVNNDLRLEVLDLKHKLNNEINNREQRELKNNIIIKGIPQTDSRENLEEIVKKMGNVLQVQVNDIKAFRIGKGGARPAPVKVMFESSKGKDSFVQAKKRKRITTKDLGYNTENPEFIFIDHDLTKQNQELYRKARIFRKENDYKFIWLKDGKVLLRKDERSKAILFDEIDDQKN